MSRRTATPRAHAPDQAVPLGITTGGQQPAPLKAMRLGTCRITAANQMPGQRGCRTRGIKVSVRAHHHAPAEPSAERGTAHQVRRRLGSDVCGLWFHALLLLSFARR